MISSALRLLNDLLPPVPGGEESLSTWSVLGVTNVREALTLIAGAATVYSLATGILKKTDSGDRQILVVRSGRPQQVVLQGVLPSRQASVGTFFGTATFA